MYKCLLYLIRGGIAMAYGKITKKQQEILDYIKNEIINRGFPPAVREICEAVNLKSTSSVHSHLETLEKNGYIKFYELTVERNPFIHKVIDSSSKLNLNDEQKSAYDAVEEAIDDCMNSEFLLFGVTGSGKTEVYLQLIGEVIKKEKKQNQKLTLFIKNILNIELL